MARILSMIALMLMLAPLPLSANPNNLQPANVAAPKLGAGGLPNRSFMRSHAQMVENAALTQPALVFLGDSITAQWANHPELWRVEFGHAGAANYGIGADRVQHLLWRVENGLFDQMRPKVVVLLIGTNNAGARLNNPPEEIADGIHKIIGAILTRSPETKILLQAIFPRGARKADQKNKQVNALISAFHDGDRVHYIDFNHVFLAPTSAASRAVMPDLLHLNAAGYAAWADAIRAPLAGLMQ